MQARLMDFEQLPAGITGFTDRRELPIAVDREAFKSACHLIAGMDRGVVEHFDVDPLARNYSAATVRTKTDHLSVLCNALHPCLAFVRPASYGFRDLEFVAPVGLASLFAELTVFEPLDSAWLNGTLEPSLLVALAPVERKQVEYWKPQRIGEVIFNCWD